MTVLIPAYKPDERMITLLEELLALRRFSVLIVDDGSGGDYAPYFTQAQAMGCTVLHQEVNQGKGMALKRGFTHLKETGETEGVVCADCDGQHLVKDIVQCAEAALVHKGVMVLGKRHFVGEMPFRSRFGNTVTRYVFYMASGTKIFDVNTGLRAYSADMLDYLAHVDGARFEYEMNLLVCCKRDGYDVLEVPIEMIYRLENHTSHFRTFADTFCVAKALLRFNVSSIAAFLVDLALFTVLLYLLTSAVPAWGPDFIRAAAMGVARVLSSATNYFINKYFVFGGKTQNSILKYAIVVAIVAAGDYGLQSLMVNLAGWGEVLSRLFSSLAMFLVSFLLQRLFVFKYKT